MDAAGVVARCVMARAVQLWSDEAIDAIHTTALNILARVGVKVPS